MFKKILLGLIAVIALSNITTYSGKDNFKKNTQNKQAILNSGIISAFISLGISTVGLISLNKYSPLDTVTTAFVGGSMSILFEQLISYVSPYTSRDLHNAIIISSKKTQSRGSDPRVVRSMFTATIVGLFAGTACVILSDAGYSLQDLLNARS